MTKSTITREQLEEWVAQFDEDGGCDATDMQLEALIRQSLAAMDSESGCLPLDYLQGHKDGLEWAAQLAEANHPETGDWLYDDPIELAKAIRKGPDMPPAQPAPVVPAVSDDIGEIRVGRLPTMNQDDYPGLGDWWVQLRIGEDSDEVLARVYGATPQEANNRAEALACRAAMLSGGKS
ncbi:hypothetical protein L1Q20_05995 [Klebsiella pneumoniae]|uniref:hypothetical protein n=1 Tax=Klebsiella pneumoniae TaxID=573 RepID=UPI00187E5333|nr:hypothetical protein [Klebsiella pneumoniae]MBE8877238.1 hypothetical protein [Klebsiella pneumoniae]HBQ7168380.1 hypothetical protein [Klebsiella pneumoniae]